MANYSFSYSDLGFFVESYGVPQKQRTVSDFLILEQAIGTSINYVNKVDTLHLNQDIKYHYSLSNINYVDTLNLTDKASPTNEERVSDLLQFTEDIFRFGYSEVLSDSLILVENLIGDHTLINRTVSDNLNLQQYINPAIFGQSIVPPDPNVANHPSIPNPYTYNHCDVPSYPTFQLNLLSIRAPLLGNKDSYHRERINVRSRGNELIIFAPDFWPKDATTELEFDTLSYDQVKALSNFIDQNAGKIVAFVDHEKNSFVGMVITPDFTYSQSGRGCNYKGSFSFQRFF